MPWTPTDASGGTDPRRTGNLSSLRACTTRRRPRLAYPPAAPTKTTTAEVAPARGRKARREAAAGADPSVTASEVAVAAAEPVAGVVRGAVRNLRLTIQVTRPTTT